MSLNETELLKELEDTLIEPCTESEGDTTGGDANSGENKDEGGRPLPIIPPGGPATPPNDSIEGGE